MCNLRRIGEITVLKKQHVGQNRSRHYTIVYNLKKSKTKQGMMLFITYELRQQDTERRLRRRADSRRKHVNNGTHFWVSQTLFKKYIYITSITLSALAVMLQMIIIDIKSDS